MTSKTKKQSKIKAKQAKIRQPIITLAGHIDHGKTSLLDKIRGTAIALKEPGQITQTISCTTFPSETLKKLAKDLLEKFNIKLTIPGFLFIDTPGHAAFTNLRKRGGSLSDIVILVIDIREGIMEQTHESIKILKDLKVPFIIALNKIDAISGWQNKHKDFLQNLNSQADYVREEFDKKFYKIVTDLSSLNFESDLFEKVTDFTKKIAIVPCSAKTGEGIPELLVMLAGISQKFLSNKLEIKNKAKGTILEVKKEKLTYAEAVVYDGTLKKGDTVIIGSLEKPIVAKIRSLFEALPLAKGFKTAKEVSAASFTRLQLTTKEPILPGMPLITTTQKEIEKAKQEIQKQVQDTLKLDKKGIIIKADSLGSLEALLLLLHKQGINVRKASIGEITKTDIIEASNSEPLQKAIIGFNIPSKIPQAPENIEIIIDNVIYKLIEKFEKWIIKREKELQKEKLSITPCKIKVLKGFIFRKNKPAIFGVKIEAGTLKPETTLINKKGKKIDIVKNLQDKSEKINKAKKGQEIAISLPKITVGRQIREEETLYSNLTLEQFKELQENRKFLSQDELKTLQEIKEIKQKSDPLWGF